MMIERRDPQLRAPKKYYRFASFLRRCGLPSFQVVAPEIHLLENLCCCMKFQHDSQIEELFCTEMEKRRRKFELKAWNISPDGGLPLLCQ